MCQKSNRRIHLNIGSAWQCGMDVVFFLPKASLSFVINTHTLKILYSSLFEPSWFLSRAGERSKVKHKMIFSGITSHIRQCMRTLIDMEGIYQFL